MTHLGGKGSQASREAWLPDDDAPTLKLWGLFWDGLGWQSRGRSFLVKRSAGSVREEGQGVVLTTERAGVIGESEPRKEDGFKGRIQQPIAKCPIYMMGRRELNLFSGLTFRLLVATLGIRWRPYQQYYLGMASLAGSLRV